MAVTPISMAHHCIERVRGPMQEGPSGAGDHAPHRGGDDGVRQVLSNRLDDCSSDLSFAQVGSVAPNESAEALASTLEIPIGKLRANSFRLSPKCTPRARDRYGSGERSRRTKESL
jgi:hypothetical protein